MLALRDKGASRKGAAKNGGGQRDMSRQMLSTHRTANYVGIGIIAFIGVSCRVGGGEGGAGGSESCALKSMLPYQNSIWLTGW